MSASQIKSPLPELKLPAGWLYRRLKYVADIQVSNVDKKSIEGEQAVRLCNYVDVYKNDVITSDMEFMEATATDSQIANFALKRGDVLITKDSEAWDDIAVPAVVAEEMPDVLCGYHLARIRSNPALLDGRYLARCFAARGIAEQFSLAANGITRFGLGKDEITGGWLPIPPLETQRCIADYLDRETSRIDALVAAKERVLTILAEKRQALIAHALTRGLNPAAPLRDSGLPWLGVVPTHWSVMRLRFLLSSIEQGWSPQCENRPADDDEWGVLKVGCVNGTEFDPRENKALPPGIEPEIRYEIQPDDILVSRGNTLELVGSAALVRDVRPKLLLCDLLYRLRVDPSRVVPEFVVHQFRSPVGRGQVEVEASGTSNSMKKIGQETIQNFLLAFPPIHEQEEIVMYISSRTARIDAIRQETARTITLLRERRTALIAAAVTGQLTLEG